MRAAKPLDFHQRTLQARSVQPRDLLPDLGEEVRDVEHGMQTRLQFVSGRERLVEPHRRLQVIRDGRRAARAWLLDALEREELPESSVRSWPWYLADALRELVESGHATRTGRGTFVRAA